MMLLLSHVGRMVSDLTRFALRSGRWWFVAVALVLAIASALIVTAKAVVPVTTYTLF